MRIPKYLSFSALNQFESDRDEFVLRYLVEDRPEREAQGKPASVGSAFDARVKAELYEHSYGPGYMPEKYSYEALFEKQVDPHNRDFAGPEGCYVFDCYKVSGMLDRIKRLADKAIRPPQYEFDVTATIGGVPLLGKPDGHIPLPDVDVVLDWKVNGYCGNSATSPTPGFLLCMDGYIAAKQSKSHNSIHKSASVGELGGVKTGGYLEDACVPWATQLSGYAWCLGRPVGCEKTVFMIHQCVAKPRFDARPLLRFAEFAGPVRQPFQAHVLSRYQLVWLAIQNNHIYTELSPDESRARYRMMAAQATSMVSATGEDKVFNELIRPTFRGY